MCREETAHSLSYRNTSILSFFIQERPIFGAGVDGVASAAGAVFRDTHFPVVRTYVERSADYDKQMHQLHQVL